MKKLALANVAVRSLAGIVGCTTAAPPVATKADGLDSLPRKSRPCAGSFLFGRSRSDPASSAVAMRA